MSWFKKIALDETLLGLAAEVRKYPTFEEFERAFLRDIKHGTYWHLTDNQNFIIDPAKGPTDMSSMSTQRMTPGALMITSDLSHWIDFYNTDPETGEEAINRPYAALIDMTEVESEDYKQVSRGFGNEFFIHDPSKAKVIGVYPLEQAIQIDSRNHNALPQNREKMRQFYDKVKGQQSDELV